MSYILLIDLHGFLRQHKIYIEMGHAEEGLVEILIIWFVIAVINVMVVFIRKIFVKLKDKKE